MAIYKGIFEKKEDVFQEFSNSWDELDSDMKKEMENCNILFAWYGNGSYDGTAFVLFERDGDLYEVNGSHCSCYGLEDQWDPEMTSVEELEHRIREGGLGHDTYTDDGVFDVELLLILRNWKLLEFVQYGELDQVH